MIPQQETFDIVVNHLRQQGEKGVDESLGTCVYRGPNGLMCAAGVLIRDDQYSSDMEGWGVTSGSSSDKRYELSKAGKIVEENGHDIKLVIELQNIHDFHEIRHWESKFKELADRHNLIYTIS